MSKITNVVKNAQVDNKYQNRGLDTKSEETNEISVGLLDIDTTIITYIESVIQPFVVQDGDKIGVPIMYGNPERWKNIRQNGVLRDVRGKLQIPLLVITRTGISKNQLNNPTNKYQELNFHSTQWNPRNKYDRFALLNGVEESKKYVSVVYPDYYDLTYSCVMWTEYMAQMNHLIEQISFETENYWGDNNQHKFKTSVSEFKNTVELPERKDRLVRSEFTMTVKAYILPKDMVDRYGNPTNMSKTRFTTRKMIIDEKIIE